MTISIRVDPQCDWVGFAPLARERVTPSHPRRLPSACRAIVLAAVHMPCVAGKMILN